MPMKKSYKIVLGPLRVNHSSPLPYLLNHLLDLLLVQPNPLPIAFDNLALGLDAGDDFALDVTVMLHDALSYVDN